MNLGRYQIVFWPPFPLCRWWPPIAFRSMRGLSLSCVYDWCLWLGPIDHVVITSGPNVEVLTVAKPKRESR